MGLLRRRPRSVGRRSRRSLVERLEPRILLSADLPGPDLLPGPSADEIRVDGPSSEALTAAIEQHALRREIVFVDAGVEDADVLLAGLLEGAAEGRELEVIHLDGGRDGIAQIGEALAGRTGSVDAVHVVSHGTDAGLQLGATWLTGENLESHVGALASWSEALAADADLLLYGCNLAGSSEGLALVETLGLLTGADVAASVDPTGAAARGGDWDLEYTRGSVESRLAFAGPARQAWSATLAPVDLTLHLATRNDVTSGGQPGTDTFSEGDLIAIRDPNLDLGPGTTNGTFSIAIDVDAFAPGIDLSAAHVVSRNITIGSPGFQLLAGDLLLTSKASATTFTSNNTAPRDPGFAATVDATDYDLVVYRPDTPGDYSTGAFALLLEDVSGETTELRGITLVEQDTSVGGTLLEAGDFLFARASGSKDHDIYVYQTGTIGAGSTPDGRPVLLRGEDAQVGIIEQIRGIELLEQDATIGGETLSAGTLLVAVSNAEPVGSNDLPVDEFDVFALDVAQSTLAAGVGNGSASATMLFDGSQVGFNDLDERVDAVALTPTAGVVTAHYLDRFDTASSYAGDDGSLSWSNDWQEFADSGGPSGGRVSVVDWFLGDGGSNVELQVSDDGGVWREADLSGAASATLSFDYARDSLEGDDHLVVYVQSSSVGAGIAIAGAPPGGWHEVGRYSGAADDSAYLGDSIDISAFIAPDTRVMFVAEGATDGNDRIWVDDVRIDLAGTATSVNDAPEGADNTVATMEDTPFVFQLADFGFSDPLNGDGLQAVVVTTAPGAGTLRDGATVLTGGETVSAASIAAGDLVFTPGAGESGTGYASFTFQVQDDGGIAGGGVDTDPTPNTMTIDVAAPGSAALWFSTDENVIGSGAPGLDSWDDGAVLQFDPSSLGATTAGSFSKRFDLDALAADGNADVDALHYVRSAITVGGANAIQLLPGDVILSTVGDETLLGTPITDGDVVVFRPSASDYSDGSVFVLLDIPGVVDAKGIALVEQDTTIGGFDLTAGSFLYSDLGARSVWHYTADDVGPGTTTGTSSLLIDADAIGLSNTNAIRDFTLISSPTTIGGVVLSPGQLLISTDENDTVGGIPTTAHQIIALDVTSAGAGTVATASVLFDGPQVGIESGDEKIFPFTLVAGNEAPVLSPSGPALTPITEDDTANAGDLVSDLLGSSVTDADPGALEGIAITALASGDGTWEFSTNGGGSWAAVGAVSDSNALLLRATDRVRFVPDGEGADAANFDFRAWDQTIGAPGSLFDATLTGGHTAFSDDVDTANITVAAVNDAPSGADNTVATGEDTDYVFQFADFGFSDPVEGDAFQAVVITTVPGAGTLRDGATVLTGGETVSAASIAAGNLAFTPAPGQSGTGYASFGFQVQDDGGTANGGVDTDPTPNTMTIDVIAVVAAADDAAVTTEGTPVVIDVLANDTGSGLQVLDLTQPANGTAVDNGDGTITYTPDAGFSGADAFDYVITDGSDRLSHYWGLDGDAVDAVGSSQGVVSGTTTVPGSFADALRFDQVDDYVVIPDFSYASDFTVTFRFKIDDITGSAFQYLYSHGDFTSPESLDIYVGESGSAFAGVMLTNIEDPNDPVDATALNVDISALIGDGQWHTYALVVTSGVGSAVYIDGVPSSAAARGQDGIDPGTDLYLGRREDADPDRFYGGSLDSVAVFDRALTPVELASPFPESSSGATVTVTVNPVNDAPSGADNTVATPEDTPYVFGVADFGFSDADGDSLQGVVITTAPGAGTLRDGATVLTGGETVSAASIAAGNLVFTPAPDESGTAYASFGFQVQDDGGTANGGVDTDPTANILTIDVTAVNDAPSGADNTVVTSIVIVFGVGSVSTPPFAVPPSS